MTSGRGAPSDIHDRFKQFLNTEKQVNETGRMGYDEEQLLNAKLDLMTKDKLIREYRVLFYRNREVRLLLQEYFNANADLVDQAEGANKKVIEIMKKNDQLQKKN